MMTTTADSHESKLPGMVYYARLSVVFPVIMTLWSPLTVALVFAEGSTALPVWVALFGGAWILEFIGHKIEGEKSSFFEDIQCLWVGPLFVINRPLPRLGIRW